MCIRDRSDAGRPVARVVGHGVDADLARHVLTRSGYRVVEQPGDEVLTIGVTDEGWAVDDCVLPTLSQLHEHLIGRHRERARS